MKLSGKVKNFIFSETKVFDKKGELIAHSASYIPLQKGECELCRAAEILKNARG